MASHFQNDDCVVTPPSSKAQDIMELFRIIVNADLLFLGCRYISITVFLGMRVLPIRQYFIFFIHT